MEIDVKIKKTTGETEHIKYAPQKNYDKANTVQIKMKLNKKTDADIIEFLQTLDNRQGYLKELIREDMKIKKVKEGTKMEYIIMDCTDTDIFNESFETAEEAIEQAELDWEHMTAHDKNRRTEYYVLKSANPDEEAEDHFDGDIVKRWK